MKIELQLLQKITLASGKHQNIESGVCAMEAVAYIAGEPWTDHPACVSPIIGVFMRNWNDSLRSNADRDHLLKPLIPSVIGTATNADDEQTRGIMAMDWMVREFTPAWFDLTPLLAVHAGALRAIPEIRSWGDLGNAMPILLDAKKSSTAARDAARDAARGAAWDAAGGAAWGAAWDAAGDAAWDAARDAAGGAARDAARDAAWDAAGDAARDAAWDAARDALNPTTAKLQESASKLVLRMCEVGRAK